MAHPLRAAFAALVLLFFPHEHPTKLVLLFDFGQPC
jgi:hypothetical protein